MTTERDARSRVKIRQIVGYALLAFVVVLVAAALSASGAIQRTLLNPRIPFQVYEPPAAPDYADRASWALFEMRSPGGEGEGAPVFFLHSTTYEGGDHWNGPLDDPSALEWLRTVALPNHAAPFGRVGPVSAPLYRQSSLYSRLTPREDAREARAFAYADVEAAFDVWLSRHPDGPLVLAGVEQGGELLARLIQQRVAGNPDLARRIVAAYMPETLLPGDEYGPDTVVPACERADQTTCILAWKSVPQTDEDAARYAYQRGMDWTEDGRLEEFGDRRGLCVNPILGARTEAESPQRRHLGAVNATDLEWSARPAFLARQVTTRCEDGLLRYSAPRSAAFSLQGDWVDRRKVPPFNLFYADIEADVARRLESWRERNGQSADGRSARQSNSASST